MSSKSSSNSGVAEENATGCNDNQNQEQNGAQADDNPVFQAENATDSNDSQNPEQNGAQADDDPVNPEVNADNPRFYIEDNSVYRVTFRFVIDCMEHILKFYRILWKKPTSDNCRRYFTKDFGKAFMVITELKRNFYRKHILRIYNIFKDKEEAFVNVFLTFSLLMCSEVNSESDYWKLVCLLTFAGECAHVFHSSGNPIGVEWTVAALTRYIASSLLKGILNNSNYKRFTKYCKQEADAQRTVDTPEIRELERFFIHLVNKTEELTMPDFMVVEGYLAEDLAQYMKLRRNDPQSLTYQAQLLSRLLDNVKEEHRQFLETKSQSAESHVEGEGVKNRDGSQDGSSTSGARSNSLLTITPLKAHELYPLLLKQMNTHECNETKHNRTQEDVSENHQPADPESNVNKTISDKVETNLQQLSTAEDAKETISEAISSLGSELIQLAVTESSVKETNDGGKLQLDNAAKTSSSKEQFCQPQLGPPSKEENVECKTENDAKDVQPEQVLHVEILMENPVCSESADNSIGADASEKCVSSNEIEQSAEDANSPQKNQSKGQGKNKKKRKKKR